MRVLVTGGSGLIGQGVVAELERRGHSVRVLSRRSDAVRGDVSDASTIHGAAANCDAVLHIAGIVEESPPDATFDRVNVAGTRNIIAEAERAGVRKFVYVSSLGVQSGTSAYQRSKLDAEELVERSGLSWVIVRPGSVYGPGDEVVSTILKMVRASPVVPVIDGGDQEFQPIWYEDLAKILAAALEDNRVDGQIVEAAGPQVTTMNDLLRRFAEITGRRPLRVPVPAVVARWTRQIDVAKETMLRERNVLRGKNAAEILKVSMTPLDRGLRMLADSMPETTAEEGVGALHHKRFFAEINGSKLSPASLMKRFRDRVTDFMPIDFAAEPGAPERIEKGATLTGSLPLRGHFQVRVEVVEPAHVVLVTIEGHPLAGAVEFTAEETTDGMRFAIDTWTRASNVVDWLALKAGGEAAQSSNWRSVVQRAIEASGGTSDGVHEEKETLDEDEAKVVERRIRDLVDARKQDDARSSLSEQPS